MAIDILGSERRRRLMRAYVNTALAFKHTLNQFAQMLPETERQEAVRAIDLFEAARFGDALRFTQNRDDGACASSIAFWKVLKLLTTALESTVSEGASHSTSLCVDDFRLAIENARSEGNRDLEVFLLSLLSLYHWHISRERVAARAVLDEIAKIAGDELSFARYDYELLNIFRLLDRGSYHLATTGARTLVRRARQDGNQQAEAHALRHLAYARIRLGELAPAISAARRGARLSRESSGLRRNRLYCLALLGDAFSWAENYESALTAYFEARGAAEEVGSDEDILRQTECIAITLGFLGRHEEKLKEAKRLRDLAEATKVDPSESKISAELLNAE